MPQIPLQVMRQICLSIAVNVPYQDCMLNLRDALLFIADTYGDELEAHGGKSLPRVSTIVLNQGGFFRRLRDGKTCTIDSFEAMLRWFAEPANWPDGCIPGPVAAELSRLVAAPLEQDDRPALAVGD